MGEKIIENLKEVEEKIDYNVRLYKEIYKESIQNPSIFWSKLAEELIGWFEPWREVFKHETVTKWFIGGKLNASYNAIDRHLNTDKKFKAAIIWESEKGEKKELTYQDLFYEVNRWANALRQLGVKKGDRVTIYMPLTPEGILAMLACARIGAIHSVVFAGFGSQALADRIADAQSKVVITTDGYCRRGKLIELKKTVDEALEKLHNNPVKHVIVFRRSGVEIQYKENRDIYFDEIGKYKYVEPEPIESTHPLFILYTSGTTGKPKGIVHSTGGYLVGTATMLLWSYGLSQDNDVLFNTSDIGWIVGHSYITYSPLVMGKTVIIYESAPDYPYPDKWAELIEKYRATTFGTSATFLRYLMRYNEEYFKNHDLSSLRILVTNGEPLNYAPWKFGLEIIGKGKIYISHQWWQTETGAPNLGYMPGYPIFLPMKSGPACGFPLPGSKIKVLDENGNMTKPRERGYLVMEPPFPPSMMIGMWNDEGNERLIKTYFSKFPNLYYTGDFAMIDEDGYVWVSGRADETLKIAGHRIGAGEVESAITSHPAVAEAAVVGVPDPIKGEIAHAFVVLKQGYTPNDELAKDIQDHVRKVMGSIVIIEIHFVNALPKTRSGKVMRRVIKAVITGATVGDLSTLEDEASMDEIKRAIEKLKNQLGP
ncbi:acetate--CoA ligase [Sulfolobus tengchongensis]|uniref:Acetate--CoA ligase n=1 Tax=Sulfolobus tengchongensis TaxID=207809 RepID=A0AAX4KZL2_9CREN